jgi:NADPH-dependent F420 reductase
VRIGIVGGAGAQGSGLAYRWARAGHVVHLGSRDPSKSEQAAAGLNARLEQVRVFGTDNLMAARATEIVVLAVPFSAHRATLEEIAPALQGKILIDVTVPLKPPKVSSVRLPASGSCVVDGQAIVGPGAIVVSAFQNVSAHKLHQDERIECDVLVCSDDAEARAKVISLAADAGMRGVDAGLLVNSVVAEALTSALIWINRQHGVKDAGIRITGLDRAIAAK